LSDIATRNEGGACLYKGSIGFSVENLHTVHSILHTAFDLCVNVMLFVCVCACVCVCVCVMEDEGTKSISH